MRLGRAMGPRQAPSWLSLSACSSGDCHKGDGPYKNKCKDPSHPSHYDKKPNGASCKKDDECRSGDCHKGAGEYQKDRDPYDAQIYWNIL